jgi:hypothetical protein
MFSERVAVGVVREREREAIATGEGKARSRDGGRLAPVLTRQISMF